MKQSTKNEISAQTDRGATRFVAFWFSCAIAKTLSTGWFGQRCARGRGAPGGRRAAHLQGGAFCWPWKATFRDFLRQDCRRCWRNYRVAYCSGRITQAPVNPSSLCRGYANWLKSMALILVCSAPVHLTFRHVAGKCFWLLMMLTCVCSAIWLHGKAKLSARR